jgi:hypothetical protein
MQPPVWNITARRFGMAANAANPNLWVDADFGCLLTKCRVARHRAAIAIGLVMNNCSMS